MNLNRAVFILIFSVLYLPTFGQRYNNRADSAKLNVEYSNVQSKIAQLTLKRDEAQLKLSSWEDKSELATMNAQNSTSINLNNANAAQQGGISEAKEEKKSANLAYKDSKIEKKDRESVRSLNKRIRELNSDIQKNQSRLRELEAIKNRLQD